MEKDYRTVYDDEGNATKEYFETQTKIPVNEIRIYEERFTDIEILLINFGKNQTAITSRRCWDCPKCGNKNEVAKTPKSDRQYGSNATFGVIYERPRRTMMNRSSLDRLSMKWVTDFMREVDVGLMAYQKAYFDEHGHDMSNDITPFGHDDDKI